MVTTASTSTVTVDSIHGLTAGQLLELQEAVRGLDAHLVRCVHNIQKNLWTNPTAKDSADRQVRELVVSFFLCPLFLAKY